MHFTQDLANYVTLFLALLTLNKTNVRVTLSSDCSDGLIVFFNEVPFSSPALHQALL